MTTQKSEVQSGEVQFESITDELKVLELLVGQQLMNTKQSIRFEENGAWVDVEVYGREVGHHQNTNHYRVDVDLAKFLVSSGYVESVLHSPEGGGTKIELSKAGKSRLIELRRLSATESELSKLMRFIGERYTFTPEHYPVMGQISTDKQKAFAVSHSAHHMMKSLGKIAGEVERFDHGGSLDLGVLKEGVVKMLINTLKLAQELGLSASELSAAVSNMMKSK